MAKSEANREFAGAVEYAQKALFRLHAGFQILDWRPQNALHNLAGL
jgi:hypothetical protein